MNNKFGLFVGGLIVIVIVLIIAFSGGDMNEQEDNMQVQSTPAQQQITVSEEEPLMSESVLVSDGQSGDKVVVRSVEIAGPSYVVIHEDDGGKPGKVLGKSTLLSANANNITIMLDREIKAGETLYAMLHRDDGDGVYEFPGDDAPVKSGGKVVLDKFSGKGDGMAADDMKDDKDKEMARERTINMVSGNFFFSPNNMKLVKGEKVKINFQNTGIHTFTIDELGVNVRLTGRSGQVEFTPNKAGKFRYYCAIPGHAEAGMIGGLEVLEQ